MLSVAGTSGLRHSSSDGGPGNSTLPILSFLIALFLALMAIKFQSLNSESPFQTHAVIMPMFVITVLVYAITLYMSSASYFPHIINHISLLCGSLSPVLLALILFPSVGGFFLVIWFIYFVMLIHDAYQKLYRLYQQISSVSEIFNDLIARHAHQETIQDSTSRHSCSNGGPGNSKLPILSFLIPVFLALMAIKFRSLNSESPFQTDAVVMPIFVITILVYAITLDMSSASYFPHIINPISLLCGSLSPVLLALILFPSVGGFFLVIWFIHFAKLIHDAYQKLYRLYQQVSSVSEFFNDLIARHAHQETIQDSTSSSNASTARNHRQAILGFPIVVLLALLPQKFHSMNMAAPFETNSAVMSAFVISTLVYVVAWAIEAKLQIGNSPYHQIIISKISLFSASLATVLLVLVIVPALGWFFLLLWTLFFFKLITYDACRKLRQLHQAISSASDVFNEVLGRSAHPNERSLLPV